MTSKLRPEDISEDDLKVPCPVRYRVLLAHAARDENALVLGHLETTVGNQFEFIHAGSIAEAMQTIGSETFDLLVLAIDLPDGRGLDGFETVKKTYKDLPVVILSTLRDRDLAMQAVKRGAHDVLVVNPAYPIELVKMRLLYSIERSRTERANRSMARTEKFALRSVVENSPLMFVRLDHSYIMRDCNRNFASVLQQPRSQLRRRSVFDLLPEFTFDEISRLSCGDQLLRKRVLLYDREKDCMVEAYWNCFGWPFHKSNSEERESIIVAIDVTREVYLDHFREEFLAAVAHDIKNPVVGQEKVLSALLKMEDRLPPDVMASLATLRNSSLQLINLLATLVEIYRLDSAESTDIESGSSLNDAISQQAEELQSVASTLNRTLVLELEEDLPHAAIDGTASYRLVANLMHNALQNAPRDSQILVKTSSAQDAVVMEVNNQGPPISSRDLAKLFHRFSRAENGSVRANSSGLGLYLCKQTVEKCGGTIMCISDVESGTTFVVKLPRADS